MGKDMSQEELDFTTAKFFGEGYEEDRDHEELTGQLKAVYETLEPGLWLTLENISKTTNIPQASVSAAIRTLRNQFGFVIDKKLRENSRGTWLYKITGRLSEVERIARKVKILKPIGDKELFGEMMRCIYAEAMSPSEDNKDASVNAYIDWKIDFMKRVREGRPFTGKN